MKDVQVSIISITSTGDKVFGLGDDNQVYRWMTTDGQWHIYKVINNPHHRTPAK